MNFNEQQLKAINTKDGQYGIIAGAGSGKSTVLIERVKKLVQEDKVPQESILCVSFTRNSSQDLAKKLKKVELEDVSVGTFHSICAKILIKEGYNLDAKILPFKVENMFKQMSGTYGEFKQEYLNIMSFISYQKNFMRGYGDDFVYHEAMDSFDEEELRSYYKDYENYKKKLGALDLDDYLLEAYKVLKGKNASKYTYDYIMVDENQDSNFVQHQLIELLCPCQNIWVIGDFRQSIYGFNGAYPQLFMDFDKRFSKAQIINMDTNYRSKAPIVENSNIFMKHYYGDYEHYSDAIPFNKNRDSMIEEKYCMDEAEESGYVVKKIQKLLEEGVDPKEIAVIYRNNSNAEYLEGMLRLANIDYEIENNGGFFKRKEIASILAIIRLIDDPNDDSAIEELINKFRPYPFQYVPKAFLTEINTYAGKNNLCLLDAGTKVIVQDKRFIQAKRNFTKFKDFIYEMIVQIKKGLSLVRVIDNIIKWTNMKESINNNSKNLDEIEERLMALNRLKIFAKDKTVHDFLNFAYDTGNTKKRKMQRKNVQLMTIHKSKGLEWENVFIIGIKDGVFPSDKSDILEEARLFYVGVTRPKSNLYLSALGRSTFIQQYFGRQ